MKVNPTRFRLFDFDGTLVFTPRPETVLTCGITARQRHDDWREETGLPPRKSEGWWGRIESLLPPVFGAYGEDGLLVPPPGLLNGELASIAREGAEDPEFLSVLLTGRHAGMIYPGSDEQICRFILDQYSLRFDRYDYGGGHQKTLDFKEEGIRAIFREFPSIREAEIWEDRPDHTRAFRSLLRDARREGLIDRFLVHQVDRPAGL